MANIKLLCPFFSTWISIQKIGLGVDLKNFMRIKHVQLKLSMLMQTLVSACSITHTDGNSGEFLKEQQRWGIDHKTSLMAEGENVIIPCGCKHRVKAVNDACVILEISYGKFDENDIIRIEDDYCRITKI